MEQGNSRRACIFRRSSSAPSYPATRKKSEGDRLCTPKPSGNEMNHALAFELALWKKGSKLMQARSWGLTQHNNTRGLKHARNPRENRKHPPTSSPASPKEFAQAVIKKLEMLGPHCEGYKNSRLEKPARLRQANALKSCDKSGRRHESAWRHWSESQACRPRRLGGAIVSTTQSSRKDTCQTALFEGFEGMGSMYCDSKVFALFSTCVTSLVITVLAFHLQV